MLLRHALRWWVYLIVLGMVGFLATGCSTVRGIFSHEDSPALTALLDANDAINASRQAGASKHYPVELTDLEQRYQAARSTFHTGDEKQALEMAQHIIIDADALSARAMEASLQPDPEPPSLPPANQQPMARLLALSESDVNTTVSFDASGSSDQDADTLTYHWDFGDGETTSSTFPTITHQYAKVDNYTVHLRVSDGRGGSDTVSTTMQVISRQILHSAVLFGYKKASLHPSAEEHLASLVQQLRETTSYQVELIGHTDSVASADYNLYLSRQRAEAVRDFLLTQGIAAHQIRVDWKGETQPIASNNTEDGRIQNRRTEITLRPMLVQQSQLTEMTREAMTTR
jgi:outer membrane protein OmpA-like peptidoglycan-associated protein